jgi:putative oxidoreductase
MKVALEIDLKSILRWLLAVILVWAAVSKIANLNDFYADISAYRLSLPDSVLRLTTMVLPWLELLCAVLIVAGTVRRAALIWTAVLFAVFVIATGQAWARGLEISCGCMKLDFLGESAGKILESVWFAFLRAIVLLFATIFLLRQREPVASTS